MSDGKFVVSQEYQGRLESLILKDYKNNSYDIKPLHVQFVYIESIPNITIAGNVFLLDAIDYPTMLPMIGEEKLAVRFTRGDAIKKSNAFLGERLPGIEFEFPIFKLEGKNPEGGNRQKQTYTLHYCSELPFINLNKVVHKTYKGMKYSEMVKRIYDEYIFEEGVSTKPIIIEETENSGDFYFSKISPIRAIQKIAARSISKDNNGFLYVFYEGRDAYYFVTLQSLMRKQPTIRLSCEVRNVSKDSKGGFLKDRDVESGLYNVEKYRRDNVFDVLNSALSGEGTASLLTIDPLVRRYYYNEFDLRGEDGTGEEYWNKFPKLGDKKPWTEKNKMFISTKRNLTFMITDRESTTDEYFSSGSSEQPTNVPEDYYLHKCSLIAQLEKNTITATLTGDPRVQVGTVVQFDVPEMSGLAGNKIPVMKDAWIQGKYLILAVAHHFTNEQYKMTLKMVRDGFYTDIFNRNVNTL